MALSTLPWHSMVAARCQGLLTLAQRRQLGCVFDPSSPEDLFLPSQGLGQSMCALVLRGVCTSWTSGHLPLTPGFMTSARIASPCFTRPKFELGLSSARSRSLRRTSSTVMLPQVAGLFRPCIRMYSTLVCPRHTYRRHPMHQWSSCLMSSTTRSCMDSSRVVWQLYLS